MISFRFALPAIGIVALLGLVALSWRADGRLHLHALNVDGMPVFVQTPAGKQVLIGGSNSPSALLAALGSRMPFWDRDLDLIVVPKADAQSLNGLMAVVDRYHVGAIVSVGVGDNRAVREWLDLIVAKQIDVIESGLGIGIEDGMSLSLDASGWVRIDAGVTSVGLGRTARGARADVLALNDVADDTAARVQSMQPSIVLTSAPIEPIEGVTLVDAQQNAVELLFDGAQWEVRASP